MIVEQVIKETVTEWSIQFIANRRLAASKLPDLTGQGKASFDREVQLQASNDLAIILFEFEDHLRYFDMRKLRWRKQPPIDVIEDFIKKKGVSSFTEKFRQINGYLPKSNTKLINKIAWGISISFQRKGWATKRKKWYNRGKEADINSLLTRLMDNLSQEALSGLKKSII
jgi:hypothetical protein